MDGTALGWWRVVDARALRREPQHLLLTHGTFSDRRICMPLARAWAQQGHVAWVLEWRGHGSSARPVQPFDMETVAMLDMVAALQALSQWVVPHKLCTATHSGGGLVLTMSLLRQPQYQALLSRMALFACQACDAADGWWRRARLQVLSSLTRVYGRIPGRPLRLGVHDESHAMMAPWFRWNLQREFIGSDGFDYGRHQQSLGIPVMAISGTADRLIAPPLACQRHWQRYGAQPDPDSVWLRCGRSDGFSRDHSHASVMHSAAAQAEILPRVSAWLLGQRMSSLSAPTTDSWS